MIAAMSINRVIGHHNQLPWHYSQDLQFFKKITTNKVVVMGHNTYKSIGKPLPNRRNVVMTHKSIEGVETFVSIPAMLDALADEGIPEIYVIG